jgi:very-short-patch-repair endonuclease
MAEETGQPDAPEAIRGVVVGGGEWGAAGARREAGGEEGTAGAYEGGGPAAGPGQQAGTAQQAGMEQGAGGQQGEGQNGRDDSRRAQLIAAAQARWISTLTDLGGRNTLLYYKDRRAGTLDLAGADPDAAERFCRTGSVRLTRLFRDADRRADAIRRVQAIYRKARELQEERGIRAAYLATGLARWDELFLEPAAPVLLRGLIITPTRARHDDFDLALEEEAEVNPVLLHKLATVFGAATEELAAERGDRLIRALYRAAAAAEVPGFEISRRQVIGTFTYAKLPMVRDLEAAGDLLGDSDVVAAIAGDIEAQELLNSDEAAEPVLDAPEQDYSVLDADSSQRSAIGAVLSGHSLVIHGPPGTGKSQTIANLIAALVARGRKVLFVAEKRAAIDAVLSRLKSVDLGEAVLDIHEGTRDRQRIARDLGDTLDLAQRAAAPQVAGLHRRLVDRQRRLNENVAALHQVHEPWGLTPFEIQSALLGIPDRARTPVRVAAPELITAGRADAIRDELREFAHLGGFAIRPASTPWYGARLPSTEAARHACDLASRLSSHSIPLLVHHCRRAAGETGLRPPGGYREAAAMIMLYASVAQTLRSLDAGVFGAGPERLAAACGDGAGLKFRERHALRRQARALWRPVAAGAGTPAGEPSREELAAALTGAARQLAQWQELRAGEGLPALPSAHAELAGLAAEVDGQLTALRGYIRLPADPEPLLAELAADQDTAWKLPRLYELGTGFDDSGLGALLDELARRQATADLAAAAFDQAWYASILERIRVRDPRYAAHRGGALDEIASDFRTRDVEHLAANRARVRRAWAQQLRDAQDRHPLQARVIRKQAALRRGHLPLRRLVDQAHDVLFALKPCWAASPLIVSQVLPAARLFDVVIFDEASQIIPADAIPSIMRGHQIVVAGDDRQLPPTNFFRQVGDESDDGAEDPDSLVSFGAGFESVLEALRPLLPTWPLAWHYRSRDERLVAFSNTHIYGGALTTFPGVLRDDCLRHVVVAQGPEPDQEVSVTAEVEQVAELILEHARSRPSESLGVIALGIKHSDRIDAALRGALAANPGLEGFFAEDRPEPFFVKNLERVQGDERDAIILSIGYGKHPDGRMRYQWGPLLRDGGERRLNVAATRAKRRLTLVSSFSSHDIDPDRVTKAGARLLADYLEYASSGGTAVGASGADELNPFEADVRDRLAEFGITVVPQYGVGGYRIDFAAAHPQDPDRMVLAIEADGASYRQSGSARDRDRLRGEHLQRLGWSFHRLWSTNWYYDSKGEVSKLRDAYQRAVAAADEAAPPPAPAPPVPGAPPPEEPTTAPGQELDVSGPPGRPAQRSSP